jgi:hypothetical protein
MSVLGVRYVGEAVAEDCRCKCLGRLQVWGDRRELIDACWRSSHGATGHIYPLLSFADVLLAADHDVIILTGSILALPTPAERINALIALVA